MYACLQGDVICWSIIPAGLYMPGSVSKPNIRRCQEAPEVRNFYNRRCMTNAGNLDEISVGNALV